MITVRNAILPRLRGGISTVSPNSHFSLRPLSSLPPLPPSKGNPLWSDIQRKVTEILSTVGANLASATQAVATDVATVTLANVSGEAASEALLVIVVGGMLLSLRSSVTYC